MCCPPPSGFGLQPGFTCTANCASAHCWSDTCGPSSGKQPTTRCRHWRAGWSFGRMPARTGETFFLGFERFLILVDEMGGVNQPVRIWSESSIILVRFLLYHHAKICYNLHLFFLTPSANLGSFRGGEICKYPHDFILAHMSLIFVCLAHISRFFRNFPPHRGENDPKWLICLWISD